MNSEMIQCDNEYVIFDVFFKKYKFFKCEREWFHFQCVGLRKKPKENEKWYCRDCQQLKKENKLY